MPSKRVRIAVIGALIAGVTAAVVILVGGRHGGETAPTAATSTTSVPATSSPSGSSATTTTSAGTTPTTKAGGAVAAAPWRSAKLGRDAAPATWLDAWGRAKNRRTCALLAPSDPGTNLAGADGTFDPVNQNEGWDVYLRKGPYLIEILGLFDRSDSGSDSRGYTKKWADRSVARYGPDAPESSATPPSEFAPHEAVLVLPDQSCGYRIYDSQGKAHLEFVLDHLRFVQGAP